MIGGLGGGRDRNSSQSSDAHSTVRILRHMRRFSFDKCNVVVLVYDADCFVCSLGGQKSRLHHQTRTATTLVLSLRLSQLLLMTMKKTMRLCQQMIR